MLNFAERTGCGAVIMVWSFLPAVRYWTYTYSSISYICLTSKTSLFIRTCSRRFLRYNRYEYNTRSQEIRTCTYLLTFSLKCENLKTDFTCTFYVYVYSGNRNSKMSIYSSAWKHKMLDRNDYLYGLQSPSTMGKNSVLRVYLFIMYVVLTGMHVRVLGVRYYLTAYLTGTLCMSWYN